jgi:hypothetical protein
MVRSDKLMHAELGTQYREVSMPEHVHLLYCCRMSAVLPNAQGMGIYTYIHNQLIMQCHIAQLADMFIAHSDQMTHIKSNASGCGRVWTCTAQYHSAPLQYCPMHKAWAHKHMHDWSMLCTCHAVHLTSELGSV